MDHHDNIRHRHRVSVAELGEQILQRFVSLGVLGKRLNLFVRLRRLELLFLMPHLVVLSLGLHCPRQPRFSLRQPQGRCLPWLRGQRVRYGLAIAKDCPIPSGDIIPGGRRIQPVLFCIL